MMAAALTLSITSEPPQATIDAFGWKFAKALDQADFVDRSPGEMPRSSPEARFR